MRNYLYLAMLLYSNIAMAIVPSTTESPSIVKPKQIESDSTPPQQSAPIATPSVSTPIDPLENYNRNAYRMNSKIDKAVLRPVAVGYVTYIPLPIRTVFANFFNNLRDVVTLGNDIFQLNGQSAMKNIMRISINTTFGLVGILDISTSIGLVQNKNSFGNTMKTYGWTKSSYYVIPLLGPSTVRDTLGLIPDTLLNPIWILTDSNYISTGLFALSWVDTRTQFLGFDQILNASLDPYVTMRDTYLSAIGEKPPVAPGTESAPSIDSLLDEEESSN